MIRALVPYSRTLFFNDKGREMGFTAETIRDFERWINKKYAQKLGKRPLTVVIISTTRDKLLPEVSQGLGEIAAANLTVTEGGLKTVDFVSPPDLSSMLSSTVSFILGRISSMGKDFPSMTFFI